jgi:hypothetical protein
MVAMNNVMCAYCPVYQPEALDFLRIYMQMCWRGLISFAGFQNALDDS